MVVQFRIYRRTDPDLIALQRCGVSMPDLVRKTLSAYASGEPLKILTDAAPCEIEKGAKYHACVSIKDPASIRLLLGIKYGFRNQFCKTLIRDALVFQNVSVFFEDPDLIDGERERIRENAATSSFTSIKKKNAEFGVSLRKSEKKDSVDPHLPDGATTDISKDDLQKQKPEHIAVPRQTDAVQHIPESEEPKEACAQSYDVKEVLDQDELLSIFDAMM